MITFRLMSQPPGKTRFIETCLTGSTRLMASLQKLREGFVFCRFLQESHRRLFAQFLCLFVLQAQAKAATANSEKAKQAEVHRIEI